jgi:hypothetical protein
VKRGREVWPLPNDVKEAIDEYLRLNRKRREISHHTAERTLEGIKALHMMHKGR